MQNLTETHITQCLANMQIKLIFSKCHNDTLLTNQSFNKILMKALTDYQVAKANLKQFAQDIKNKFPNDKPRCRQEINDYTHNLCQYDKMCKPYNARRIRMFEERLHNYACKLHPND